MFWLSWLWLNLCVLKFLVVCNVLRHGLPAFYGFMSFSISQIIARALVDFPTWKWTWQNCLNLPRDHYKPKRIPWSVFLRSTLQLVNPYETSIGRIIRAFFAIKLTNGAFWCYNKYTRGPLGGSATVLATVWLVDVKVRTRSI